MECSICKNPRRKFRSLEAVIVEIQPVMNYGIANICIQLMSVQDIMGNPVNFIVTSQTYIVDFERLYPGTKAIFFYDEEAPVPLIYPPQYQAVVIAVACEERYVYVGYFDSDMISEDGRIHLNMDRKTTVVTTNNQIFMGCACKRYLTVVFDKSTKSIPSQITPIEVIVLCGI